ncbi:MAG: hypothetical protein SX243_02825 [Acidobacteriota bacterium]|nr:hypothetical protein [Acidobacteriota bacterium]
MIAFERVPQPPGFREQAEQPGAVWLETHPEAKRPRDFWTPFKAPLAQGFHNLCAYSAMFEPVGTVDHFVSCTEDRSLAYKWSNYRYAAQWINASKSSLPSIQILDPFEVENGWFKILLPSLQLVVSQEISPALRKRAEFVLVRLNLRDDERVIRQRREWFRMYQDGEISLEGLRKKAPLIARAVERQG